MASYAAALKSGNHPIEAPPTNKPTQQQQQHPPPSPPKPFSSPREATNTHRHRQRSSSPGYRANTSAPESASYILTFLTNQPHHQTLTNLRTKYFPQKLNHLSAHITLFHALPGSKLETDILPTLTHITTTTSKFPIHASHPMRLKRGIAISLPRNQGGAMTSKIHQELQNEWRGFLSEQDAGGFRPHYTIMNKVNDEEKVQRAFEEVEREFEGCRGTVEGLSLWLYEGPGWVKQRDFMFRD